MLAVGAGRVVWTFFLSSIFFLPLWETAWARYDLRYCLKGPLNQNNKPTKSSREWCKNSSLYIAATIFTLKFQTKLRVEVYIDTDLTTHSMILDSISRRFVV